MAVAGGGIPSFPISLVNGEVKVWSWATNRPAEIVEQDIDKAVERLLNGERFYMHCSAMQVWRIMQKLKERR